MSLELALQENTAAVNALAALLSKINLAPAAEAPPAKKQKAADEVAAAMERAATPTTAEQPAAPESKVVASAEQSPSPVNVEPATPVVEPLTLQARGEVLLKAVGKAGRDAVLTLLGEFGATKASQVPEDKLVEFDLRLTKLAGL